MEENTNRGQESTDDFVIGKGFTVAENEETEKSAKKKKKNKKKKRKGRGLLRMLIWIFAIVTVSVSIAFGAIYAGADFLGIGFGRGESCSVEIEQGMTTMQIAKELQKTGAVKIPLLFRLFSKVKGYDGRFKYGLYNFNNEAGYDVLAEMLITDGAKAESVTVKIPEKATIDEIAVLLEEAGVCTKGDFIFAVQEGKFEYDFIEQIPSDKVYYRLEGYLFPDTYEFYSYDSEECARLAVDKMLKTFDEKLNDELMKKIGESKYSFHQLITMAAIIEAETGGAAQADRVKVARVFYNRLEGINWDGPKFLQSDPTTYYPHGGDRYDTYKNEGLIPGPTCAPSLGSIEAAIAPAGADLKATYFVTDKNGEFYYNETLAGHNKSIADLKARGLWHSTTLGG